MCISACAFFGQYKLSFIIQIQISNLYCSQRLVLLLNLLRFKWYFDSSWLHICVSIIHFPLWGAWCQKTKLSNVTFPTALTPRFLSPSWRLASRTALVPHAPPLPHLPPHTLAHVPPPLEQALAQQSWTHTLELLWHESRGWTEYMFL